MTRRAQQDVTLDDFATLVTAVTDCLQGKVINMPLDLWGAATIEVPASATDPTPITLNFHTSDFEKGRLATLAVLPGEYAQSINITSSASRPAHQIAADIQKRVMSKVPDILAEQEVARAEHAARQARESAVLSDLKGTISATWEPYGNDPRTGSFAASRKEDRPEADFPRYMSLDVDLIGMGMPVIESVTFNLTGLSVEQARKLAATIAEL